MSVLRRCDACGGRGERFDQATHDETVRRTGGMPAMGSAIIECPDCTWGAVEVPADIFAAIAAADLGGGP